MKDEMVLSEPFNNDVDDGCLATGEGTSETNFTSYSFSSKVGAFDHDCQQAPARPLFIQSWNP